MQLSMLLRNTINGSFISILKTTAQEMLMANFVRLFILIFLVFKIVSRPKVLNLKKKNQSRRNKSVGTEMILNQRERQELVAGKCNPKF